MGDIRNSGVLSVPCRDAVTNTTIRYAVPADFYYKPIFSNVKYELEKYSNISYKSTLKNSFGVINKDNTYEIYTDGNPSLLFAAGIKMRLSIEQPLDLVVMSLVKLNEEYELYRGVTFKDTTFTDTLNVGEAGVYIFTSLNEPSMIFKDGRMYVTLKTKTATKDKWVVAFPNPLYPYVDYVYLSKGYSKGLPYFEGMFLSDQYDIQTNRFATIMSIETGEIYNCSVVCDEVSYKYNKFIKVKFNVL